jgi:hypothetical protein
VKKRVQRARGQVGNLPNYAWIALAFAILFQPKNQAYQGATDHLLDPFAAGWMVSDTNGDGIVDFVPGKVVVPSNPTAAENAAAADIAARLGFATTGLTPPIVISAAEDRGNGPRIFVGRSAPSHPQLGPEEGGVFEAAGNLAVVGHDDAGLLAAAEAFSARAPYLWKVPGDRLTVLADAVKAKLVGVTYLKGKAGVARAFFEGSVTSEDLSTAIKSPKLASVHELIVSGVSAVSEKPMAAEAPAAPTAAGAAPPDTEAGPQRLDLASLYTMRGLFRGTPRMPIPSNLDSQLYVPAGAAGIAMANLAGRMGLETTGITLPLATPDSSVAVRDVRTKSVIVEGSDLAKEAVRKLHEEDATAKDPLAAGEGVLRIVDKAFGRQSAVLVSGDLAAALGLLSEHFPNVWETGKQYLSLEEIRYDMHRFFSLRSSAGQASVALYRLDKWMEEISGPVLDVKASVYVDVADAGLKEIVEKEVGGKLKTAVKVETGSLHAGTQCCEHNPSLHYQAPGYTFHQATPTFQEDLTIPWEGTRLLNAVKGALPKLKGRRSVSVLARVSEGPEQRQNLAAQIRAMLNHNAVKTSHVEVLCAFKQGFSWLMEEIAPQLKGKPVASIKIGFKKNEDSTGMRVMYSPARWVHELYPVDEALAKELDIPLQKIQLDEFEGGGPMYRVNAYDAAGKELLRGEFVVTTVMQPYNGVIKPYEQVQVDTGWVRIEAGPRLILDQRIKTDIEEFWDHYQNETLPKIFRHVMSQSHGELRPEFAPIFDTLKIDIHMSEPDFSLGIDKEHISSLEALQEDTFYSTENFANMIGDMEAGRAVTYVGRIIPIVHAPDDGKDGHVHIEFYAKPAANPMVELSWTDAQGKHHERRRNLYALTGAMQPRLIEARATADGPRSLTWLLPADFKEDKYNDWVKLEGTTQIERGVFPVEQAKGQMQWLAAMQSAGLYKGELAYPHLRKMAVEFELPLPLAAKVESAAPREIGSWNVAAPIAKRPMIADYREQKRNSVQWDEPISPDENAAILAKLSEAPGVNTYWMGRSYLGQNLWAADVMLPSPARLRSWAKETTLKASILYSGRQHANEVSSTSHIDKLGEQLVSDQATRALLKQVNVVLHPITNSDGADLSVQLAEITLNNMLHPGYHGSLAADVAAGQAETDPVYPESRTRKQLLDAWLPDAFLNPHGYPSHEWVQPFSEYSAWVTTRQGANNGRTWWIPRGWFTSLTYLRDETHLYSEKIAYEIRDRIVEAQRNVPGLLDLENRMNARYQRFGQRWQPEDMQQPIVNGIRIYMALKGSAGRGGAGGATGAGAGGATGGVSPDITWDSGYTEAPDETAHGDYMKLMASAGLAFDRVHLNYLATAKLRINRTEREQGGKVTWRIERLRPNLPASEPEPARSAETRQ